MCAAAKLPVSVSRARSSLAVAVKLAPLLTAFAHFAKSLDDAGADGLVMFTRFHKVDIDVDERGLIYVADRYCGLDIVEFKR